MNWPDDYLIPGIEPYHVEEAGIIYCGRAEDILEKLRPDSIDLTVTSPPYDGLREYRGFEWDFQKIGRELLHKTKLGGVVVWIVGDETKNGSESGSSFKQALYFKEIGFNLHDTMIYYRHTHPLTHKRYEQFFEYMFIFSNGAPHVFNPIKKLSNRRGESLASSTFRHTGRETKPLHKKGAVNELSLMGNVWFYEVGYQKTAKDKFVFDHPAIFPEQLAADHIVSWSNSGDVVLDCHLGSGTTAKMAKELGRRFIGVEIEESYCQIAKRRLRQGVLPL